MRKTLTFIYNLILFLFILYFLMHGILLRTAQYHFIGTIPVTEERTRSYGTTGLAVLRPSVFWYYFRERNPGKVRWGDLLLPYIE